jgi:hypothetical protein
MTWYSDRTRYIMGHACAWKRLLRFHAFGQGIDKKQQYAPLATGRAIHSALESILHAWNDPPQHSTGPNFNYPAIIGPAVDELRETVTTQGLVDYNTEEAHHQVALAEALPIAYARVCEPMFQNLEILSIEQEMPIQVTDSLVWMTRSDFVTRDKTSGEYAVHDFKTAASWYDDRVNLWRDNLQQMVNAYAATIHLRVPVLRYYIHILIKGTKRSPSPIVLPWVQEAVPPFQVEDICFSYYYKDDKGNNRRLGQTYKRTPVGKLTDNIPKFVLERVPLSVLRDAIVVVGPFAVDRKKVEKFLTGLPKHELHWLQRLERISDRFLKSENIRWTQQWKNPEFQATLDEEFPRTYNCFEFGGQTCPYYNLCHNKPGWEYPITNGEFALREPHHTTEEI